MSYSICPGIVLSNGERIGAISDIDCFRMFEVDAATYIDAMNADHGLQLSKPKTGNGHKKPLWRVHKIGKIEKVKRAKQENKASKAELLALYIKLHEEGKPLPLEKLPCEIEMEMEGAAG